MGESHRAGPDSECEDVSDAGDSDANTRVLHGQSHPLCQGQSCLSLVLGQVVPARHDDKHVINANTFNQSFNYDKRKAKGTKVHNMGNTRRGQEQKTEK